MSTLRMSAALTCHVQTLVVLNCLSMKAPPLPRAAYAVNVVRRCATRRPYLVNTSRNSSSTYVELARCSFLSSSVVAKMNTCRYLGFCFYTEKHAENKMCCQLVLLSCIVVSRVRKSFRHSKRNPADIMQSVNMSTFALPMYSFSFPLQTLSAGYLGTSSCAP